MDFHQNCSCHVHSKEPIDFLLGRVCLRGGVFGQVLNRGRSLSPSEDVCLHLRAAQGIAKDTRALRCVGGAAESVGCWPAHSCHSACRARATVHVPSGGQSSRCQNPCSHFRDRGKFRDCRWLRMVPVEMAWCRPLGPSCDPAGCVLQAFRRRSGQRCLARHRFGFQCRSVFDVFARRLVDRSRRFEELRHFSGRLA